MSEADLTLSGLFLSALLSSTLLPGGSEALLIWIEQQNSHDTILLFLVATSGNTLGGLVTWGMGWFAQQHWKAAPSVTLSPKAAAWIERHGAPALLLSWLPVIGDGLCLAAGWFRIHLLSALLFITLGKALRYALLLWVI